MNWIGSPWDAVLCWLLMAVLVIGFDKLISFMMRKGDEQANR